MFYVFTLLILMFLGLVISIKNYNSINKTYLKLIELNNLFVDFINANGTDNPEKLNSLRTTLSSYLHFYNQKMSKSIKIVIFSHQIEPFNHFVLNHNDDYLTESDEKLLRKLIDGIIKTFNFNLSYYEERKSIYFYQIINPVKWFENDLDLFVKYFSKDLFFKLPITVKRIISILTASYLLWQTIVYIREHI